MPISDPAASLRVLLFLRPRNTETGRILVDSDFSPNVRCMQWATSARAHTVQVYKIVLGVDPDPMTALWGERKRPGDDPVHSFIAIAAVALRPLPVSLHLVISSLRPVLPRVLISLPLSTFLPASIHDTCPASPPGPRSPCFVSRRAIPAPHLTVLELLHSSRNEVFSVSPGLPDPGVCRGIGIFICVRLFKVSFGYGSVHPTSMSTSFGAFRPLHLVSTDFRRSAPRPFSLSYIVVAHRIRVEHRIPAAGVAGPRRYLTRSHVSRIAECSSCGAGPATLETASAARLTINVVGTGSTHYLALLRG
ncbi:hypothetical protein B0H13DRAFT_2513397 [Mycena leptocephala]|nr:hypothetical protein B0H13DRAFT_2513397 [Mycena leptocephala]